MHVHCEGIPLVSDEASLRLTRRLRGYASRWIQYTRWWKPVLRARPQSSAANVPSARVRTVSQLTGAENLRYFGRLAGLRKADVTTRAVELLDAFGLGAAGGTLVSEYSGGMRRRLDIAASRPGAGPTRPSSTRG